MKLKPNPWRLIWRFLIVLLVLFIIIFGASISVFFDFSTGNFRSWGSSQTIVLVIFLVISVVSFIPALTSYWYKIENNAFVVRKYGKEYEYSFTNIIFIDTIQSEIKNMVIFYTNGTKMVYLYNDKDGVLYKTLLRKCTNLMSRDEFFRVHPEER